MQTTNINVTEPYYNPNNTAVFHTVFGKTQILYWTCNHEIQGGECLHCALAIEGDEYND